MYQNANVKTEAPWSVLETATPDKEELQGWAYLSLVLCIPSTSIQTPRRCISMVYCLILSKIPERRARMLFSHTFIL